jgi:hypothetical protein
MRGVPNRRNPTDGGLDCKAMYQQTPNAALTGVSIRRRRSACKRPYRSTASTVVIVTFDIR